MDEVELLIPGPYCLLVAELEMEEGMLAWLRNVIHFEDAVVWNPFLWWWVEVNANDCGVWVLIGDRYRPARVLLAPAKR